MNSFDFPAVLAGPMIRRVEPSNAYFWIATSKNYQIRAELSSINDAFAIQVETKTNTMQLGENLYIHLIQVTPIQGALPTNELIGYNLLFNKGTEIFDLGDLGLLDANRRHSIVYDNLPYPTFFIQDSSRESHIFYGSCRKPHGEGDDTLTLADQQLEANHSDLKKRPHALFLLGDQIYADDVADPLIRPITELAHRLIGRKENLIDLDPRLGEEPFKQAMHQMNGRKFMMKHFCHFSSSSSYNHLIEFGEYAAMYLLAWSPTLWELIRDHNLFKSFKNAWNKGDVYLHFKPTEKEYKTEIKQLKKRFYEQQSQIRDFYHTVYSVRRLLANIPTYMIFDDHEITDDWNISAVWKKNVEDSPLGRHVVSNGLSAYWAFQGWGNQPNSFTPSFLLTMKNYFKSLRTGKIKNQEEWSEQLLTFHKWHFVAPTSPMAVFLDTRTHRKFDYKPRPVKLGRLIEETIEAPQLIDESEWNRVTTELKETGWYEGNPLIIASPTPIYGVEQIEAFLQEYIRPLSILGLKTRTTFDYESWVYNAKGFTNFLQSVLHWNPGTCVILSGDKHYASSVQANIQFKDRRMLAITQFTSSPIKNMSFTSPWGFLLEKMINKPIATCNNTIDRYCDPSYAIHHSEESDEEKSYLWKDQLHYHPLHKDSIIETSNNLGLISFSSKSLNHQFLTMKQSR